jgi:hypothetical protein
MMMDILAHFNWDRPLYFSLTSGPDAYFGLEEYFQLDGMAYRLVPIKTKSSRGETGKVNTTTLPEKLLSVFPNHARVDIVNNPERKQKPEAKYLWGGINDPRVYIPEETSRMYGHLKSIYSRTATQLAAEGNNEKAEQILDKLNEIFNPEITPYIQLGLGNYSLCYASLYQADAFLRLDTKTATEKGLKIVEKMIDELKETFAWFEKGDERTLLIQAENIEFCVKFISYMDFILPEGDMILLKDKFHEIKLHKSVLSLAKQVGAEVDFYFKKGTEAQRELMDKLHELQRLGNLAITVNDKDLEDRIFGILEQKIDLIAGVDPQTGRMLRDYYFAERD